MANGTSGSPKSKKKWWLWPFESTERVVFLGLTAILLAIVLSFIADMTGATEQSGNPTLQSGNPTFSFNWPFVLDFFVDLFKELGIAFLIAAVIAEGIERIAHDKQAAETRDAIKKIKANLLESVYETKSASVFFESFKKYVLEKPLLRTNCNLLINLYSQKDGAIDANSLLILDVTTTFSLENCSKKGEDFSMPIHIESPWPGLSAASNPNAIVVKIRNAQSGEYERVDAIPSNDRQCDDLNRFSYKIRLDALSHREIICSYKLFMYGRDSHCFTTIIPTDKMNIFINYIPLIDLFYTSIHSGDFINQSVAKGDGKLQLFAAEPLFPGNGIEFWWCPKAPKGAALLKEEAAQANIPIIKSV